MWLAGPESRHGSPLPGQGDRLGGVLYNKEGAEICVKRGADPSSDTPCLAQNKCQAEVDEKP